MYKMYRNRIFTLTRISKQSQYYTNFVNDDLTNMKKTWEGINSFLARKSKPRQLVSLKIIKDTVDHKILLHKLDHYGFRGVINIWFSSYLQGRTQTT